MRVITMTQPSERAEKIMLNVLNKAQITGNTHTILVFGSEANGSIGSPFPVFYRQFSEPKRSRFPYDAYRAFENYQYWCNYERLIASFNNEQDPRRIDFWKRYLTICKLTQYKKSQFLVMDFGNYVVVESETIGTLYFYEKEYFQNKVLSVLEKENKAIAKSWMKNSSIPVYDKRHSGVWEREVLYRMRCLGMV